MRRKTNFDIYLEEQLKNPDFAERFEKAGEAWEVALKLAVLRKEAGLPQKELARKGGRLNSKSADLSPHPARAIH